jgi:hypothetical protein
MPSLLVSCRTHGEKWRRDCSSFKEAARGVASWDPSKKAAEHGEGTGTPARERTRSAQASPTPPKVNKSPG